MADIKLPRSVPAAAWRAYGNPPGGRHGAAHHGFGGGGGGGDGGDGHREPADAVRILGLNPRAYPPEVQAVLADLMGEVDRLRQELGQAAGRQDWLETQADQDGALPVINRRAFLRELDAFLAGQVSGIVPGDDGAPPVSGALAVFYLHNFERLHRGFGLARAEDAMAHMARAIRAGVRSTDVIGAIGGAGLAVLFGLAAEEGAQAKVDALLGVLAAQPAGHGEAVMPLRVVAAVVALEGGGTGESWLEVADGHLRSRLQEADRA